MASLVTQVKMEDPAFLDGQEFLVPRVQQVTVGGTVCLVRMAHVALAATLEFGAWRVPLVAREIQDLGNS